MEYDDIMLLDTHDSIFIWVGKDSNTIEKKEAMRTAIVSLFCMLSPADGFIENGLSD